MAFFVPGVHHAVPRVHATKRESMGRLPGKAKPVLLPQPGWPHLLPTTFNIPCRPRRTGLLGAAFVLAFPGAEVHHAHGRVPLAVVAPGSQYEGWVLQVG